MIRQASIALIGIAALLAGCGGGGGGGNTAPPTHGPSSSPSASPSSSPSTKPSTSPSASPSVSPSASASPLALIPDQLSFNQMPGQFYGEIIAEFPSAQGAAQAPPRQMAFLPNGDLLVGTGGGTAAASNGVYIVPNAEGVKTLATPKVFATVNDVFGGCDQWGGSTNAHGVTFTPTDSSGDGYVFVAMECSIARISYHSGDQTASSNPSLFIKVRTGTKPANVDGDTHHTTSVLAVGNTLYVGVGSDCNACTETDATRAVVLKTDINTPAFTTVATRFRNPLALAYNPNTHNVWAGGAGQDCVSYSTQCFSGQDPFYATKPHPFEFIDPVTAHPAPADYRWPACEEDHLAVGAENPGSPYPALGPTPAPVPANCTNMIVAPVRAPAYATIIGATFYNPPAGAVHAFPAKYQGGLFFSMHGSWHESADGTQVASPGVAFVPVKTDDTPVSPAGVPGLAPGGGGNPFATWGTNPSGNPDYFLYGFQQGMVRYGRPVGLAVGPQGSLFIADDSSSPYQIYRIRPGTAPLSSVHRAARPIQGRYNYIPILPF